MALSTLIFYSTSGRMRLLSVICAIIAFALATENYVKGSSNEEAYYYILMICMIISIIMVILALVGLLGSYNINMIDNIFHSVAAIAMVICSIVFIVSVFNWKSYVTDGVFIRRLISGILGLIYGVLCANVGWLLFRV